MNNDLANINNTLKQLIQNQPGLNLQGITSMLDQLSSPSGTASVDQTRGNIAKIEAAIQQSITNLEGQQGTEPLLEQLNQLQVELMNASQSLEHQQLNQTQTETIPGKPLHMDKDPQPGPPLS